MGCVSSVSRQQKVEFVKATPLVLHMKETEIVRFAAAFQLRRYQVSQEIFREGTLSDKWYIVGEGQVDISVGEGDRYRYLCSKKAGDFFGEAAILSEDIKPRTATAIAANNVLLLEITKPQLEAYLRANESLREKLFLIIGRRMENYIEKIPFLADTPFRERQLLGSMLHYVPLKKDAVLFPEGSIGRSLYLVYQGSVDAISEKDGKTIVLNHITEGGFFGEISLMIDMPRTATIVGKDDCLLMELKKEDFQNFLKLAPETGSRFQVEMKRRIAEHFRKYKVPFFSAIPDDKYALLASLSTIEERQPDEIIFSEGDVGRTFYILAHGEVEVSIVKDGKTITLPRMGPGRYFGEIALVRDTPRTATVKTLTRCVILSITKENFDKFFEEVPEAVADFQVKLARYDAELKHFIHHPLGMEFFSRHCQDEYSSENIEFFKDSQKFKDLTPEKQKTVAQEIADKYLDSSIATLEINIKGPIKKAALEKVRIGEITGDMFAECQLEVLRLMERDSFKRFKQSQLFQDFLEAAESYEVDNRRRGTVTKAPHPSTGSPKRDSKRMSETALVIEEEKIEPMT